MAVRLKYSAGMDSVEKVEFTLMDACIRYVRKAAVQNEPDEDKTRQAEIKT